MALRDSDVYAQMLLPKGHGYPMWVPEPYDNLPIEYRRRGVSVGDVGVITSDGSFDFMFNICVPADDPINSEGVPDDFEHLKLRSSTLARQMDRHTRGSDISSQLIQKRQLGVDSSLNDGQPLIPISGGAGFEFTSSVSSGAILVLPDGASRIDTKKLAIFRNQALKHASSWYRFANVTLGRMVVNGSLYLVTGCDKASSWGVASFSNPSDEGVVTLRWTAAAVAEGSLSYSYAWETFSPAMVRTGPRREEGDTTVQNQCPFIRGFKLMIRSGANAVLMGVTKASLISDSKPSVILNTKRGDFPFFADSDPNANDNFLEENTGEATGSSSAADQYDGGDILTQMVPSGSEPYHPSNVINRFLLDEIPDTQVAVTHDNEWYSVIREHDAALPDDVELIRRIQAQYEPHRYGFAGVFLAMKDTPISQPYSTPSSPRSVEMEICTPSTLSPDTHSRTSESGITLGLGPVHAAASTTFSHQGTPSVPSELIVNVATHSVPGSPLPIASSSHPPHGSMSQPIITLYDVPSHTPQPWAPSIWQIRFILNYKRLPYRTMWVEYPYLEATLKSIATPLSSNGGPVYTLPVIVDPIHSSTSPTVLSNPNVIAEYLENMYPARPVFPEGSRALQSLFVHYIQEVFAKPLLPIIVPLCHQMLPDPNFYGDPTAVASSNIPLPEQEQAWQTVKERFDFIAHILDKNSPDGDGVVVQGHDITYADFALCSVLLWIEKIAPHGWQRVKQWNGGRWNRLRDRCRDYMDVF